MPANEKDKLENALNQNDEITLIKPGGNYGWPLVQGDEETSEIITQKHLIQSG